MMFSKILVPLDGSFLAEKILPYAVRLAHALDARLVLATVIPGQIGLVKISAAHKQQIKEKTAYLSQVRQFITSSQQDPCIKPGSVSTKLLTGEPVAEIERFIATDRIDLVLMSSRGRSRLARLITGSLAEKLLNRLTIPVMLVRPFGRIHDQFLIETYRGTGEPFSRCFAPANNRVLVALDGSATSGKALFPAVELSSRLKASLYLIKTVPGETDTARQIIEYAHQIDASVLVMADSPGGEINNLFTPHLAEQVMRLSYRPVLVIPVHVFATLPTREQPHTIK